MPYQLAEKIIYQSRDAGIERITIQGGEPFLYPYLEKICCLCKKIGMIVAIPTNGQLIDQDMLSWLKKYVDFLFFSIHGDELFHDDFVGVRGSYRNAIKNLTQCHKYGVNVGVLSSVINTNKISIPKLSLYLDNLQIPLHGILYHSKVGRGIYIDSISMDDWFKFKSEMKFLEKNLLYTRIRFEIPRKLFNIDMLNNNEYCFCLGMEKKICFIDTEGWLYPCSLAMGYEKLRYDHINNCSLNNYFNNIDWAWAYLKSPLTKECINCLHEKYCHGGCMAKRYLNEISLCENGKYIPTCILYPDRDIYEEFKEGLDGFC